MHYIPELEFLKQTFDQYILSLQHSLELKYFHFAQFLLDAYQAAHWLEKVRIENLKIQKKKKLKFRTDLQDQVMYGWSATQ